jgi:hypothetical protein
MLSNVNIFTNPEIKCDTIGCHCMYANPNEPFNYSFRYINNEKNYIYYSIPKSASTFVRSTLFPDSYGLSSKTLKQPCQYSIKSSKSLDKKYFSFTFVRNPWSRMVSNWVYFTSNKLRIHQMKLSGHDLSKYFKFKDFVRLSVSFNNHHWQPQHLFLGSNLDYIGKVENLNQDWFNVCKELNLSNLPVKKVNTTNHKHYTEYYDDETREIVAEKYAKDIEYFGYKFGE